MIATLGLRSLRDRPWRSAFLLFGYATGVGVMIVLLAIGEALVTQARDERLIGGGDVTVLPEGLDVEVMKTGGVGGLYFSIPQSRFVYRQMLASQRFAGAIRAVAPQIDGRLVFLRSRGIDIPARAIGEIPSATQAVGAGAMISAGAWTDDVFDRRWLAPSLAELRHEVDRFHLPPASVADRATWAEWHYANVLSSDRKHWAFVTLMVAGDVPRGRWGGRVIITLRDEGGTTRRFARDVAPSDVDFDTTSADVRVGGSSMRVLPDGRYHLVAEAPQEGGGARATVDLVIDPARGAYFPPASLSGGASQSGYAVGALRAIATGTVCDGAQCRHFDDAQAYHDHNWGTWRDVTWDWGAARAGELTLLYGRVNAPDVETPPLVVYVVDSLGFLGVFRPTTIHYRDARTVAVDGRELRVPASAIMGDARGGDTLDVELTIEDAIATDVRRTIRSGASDRPYFVQMKGIARVRGRVRGRRIAGEGSGFFETYR